MESTERQRCFNVKLTFASWDNISSSSSVLLDWEHSSSRRHFCHYYSTSFIQRRKSVSINYLETANEMKIFVSIQIDYHLQYSIVRIYAFSFEINLNKNWWQKEKAFFVVPYSLLNIYIYGEKKRIEYNVNSRWWWTAHLFKWAFTSIKLFMSFLLLSPISLHDNKKGNSIELKRERERSTRKDNTWKEKNIELIVALHVACAWGNLLSLLN